MAKIRLTSPTFDASEKTVTHASFSDVTLAGIQLIVNVTDQVIIYNFADTAKGGTLSTDTLTLEYDTTSMSDTDELMVLVEDGVASQAVTAASLPLPSGAATSAKQDTIIGHLDGVEGLLTTIDADTGTIATEVAGLLTDTELRATPVPVSGTVTANLSATDNAVLDAIAASVAAIDTDTTTLIGHVDGIEGLLGGTIAVSNAGLTELAAAINGSSQVDVNIAASAVSFGGTSAADDADFVAGTTPGTPVMGVYDSTPDTVTDGDLGTIGINSTRAVRTVIEAGSAAIGKLAANSGVDIGDVDVTSCALPTGASTLAEQQSQTTHLATIAGDTTDIEAAVELLDDTVATLGTTTYSEATTKGLIVGAVRRDADTTLVDTTNEITPLQVDANGRLKVEAFSGETLPVSLTSTTITGTVAVTQSGTWDEIGINDSGNSITVDNAGTFATQATLQAGTAYAGKVRLTDGTTDTDIRDLTNSNALNVAIVDGSGDQITSFGGGTQYTEDAAAAANPVGTALMLVREDGRAGSLTTTDGDNVAARGNNKGELYVIDTDANSKLSTIDADTGNISTKIDTIAGAVSGTEMQVDVLTMPTVTVTATNLDVQSGGADLATSTQAGAIQTAVELIDNAIHVDDAAFTLGTHSGVMMMGFAGTQSVNANDAGAIAMETDGSIHIHDGGNTITVDGTITANLSATDNTVLDNIDADTSAIQTAVELVDDTVYVDDADWTADTSKHLLVGGVTQVATTANTDGDVTPLTTNAFRELRVAIPESDLATAGTAHVKKYYTNAGAVTDGIIWSPAAGKRWYITSIFINVSAACTVTLEDDLAAGDSPIMKAELAANSGWSSSFPVPWFSGEDAADLIITTTAGNVYVTVVGYEI